MQPASYLTERTLIEIANKCPTNVIRKIVFNRKHAESMMDRNLYGFLNSITWVIN